MTPLQRLLETFRSAAVSEREKGTYFEELCVQYLKNEATYRDLYSEVLTYAQWADEHGHDKKDVGIDLVAKTYGTDEYHAIQCKFFAASYRVQKSDIDSFFTASGKKDFSHRVIITTTNNWNEHAEAALINQHPPVTKIDLNDLENSQIDWSKYKPKASAILKPKKSLRDHQKTALASVEAGFKQADRGKLIMACGTGKTFTSLKIAEKVAGKGKRVLFLVPSLALLSQSLTEWTQESDIPLHSFAVCSDSDVGKKRKVDEDIVQTFVHELRYPATTDSKKLAAEMTKRHDSEHMSVVFSTYHSIAVISDAQKQHGLEDFDLIICDEAHRTTGATFGDEDESNFVRVHDNDYLKSVKRLYMTATPRIYADSAKASAEKDNVALCSMDDESLYGDELYVITFSEAVKRGLLVDYKVLVLAVDEAHVSKRLQKLLADDDNSLKVDDAGKIIGCWKALAKVGTQEELATDSQAMKRAVAFCQVIEEQKGSRTHKVSSKQIAGMFQRVVEAYQEQEEIEEAARIVCEAEHVDGSMNASQKEEKLSWLKAEIPDKHCRILSNVRCLSEGVDVPALDAVLFLTPRNSQVDVVQSVGRVMRNAQDKKLGYVILPVVIPAGMEAHEALNDNKTYKVVWQVLQALRSHDDRFDAMINKLDLIGSDKSKMEVVAITDKIQKKQEKREGTKNKEAGKGGFTIGSVATKNPKEDQGELAFEIGEIERAIYAKVVQKCGNRSHWEDWANDISKIARTHITRIKTILENPSNNKEITVFNEFAKELRDDLNDSISDEEIIEMLAQHLITKPVFDALFKDYSFAQHNPMSLAMQSVLDVLQEHNIDKEADTLQKFYESVAMRAEGIENAAGKQKIIVELYDKFFANAFPKLRDKLGIVYTPVEVVDFIIHSVNDILKDEFGQTLGDKNVHIIDPFTGTGTFITRLMQSGLINPEQLPYKYKNEIHANEIVLLAYYIAAINIEAVYHSIVGGNYQPFEGICLTDTFQMYEKEDLVAKLMIDNSGRRTRQKALDIRIIFGNPPYSAGQKSEGDDAKNTAYPTLDAKIRKTYATQSKSKLQRYLYDSYIRAIRWASDRIGNTGIVGFVSGNGWIDKAYADGMRKCLEEEYTSIYIVNLRGDVRKNMLSKGAAREGENIFGQGSMTGAAISFFVKNPSKKQQGVFYFDIGDDLKLEQKLELLGQYESISKLQQQGKLALTCADDSYDWINKRDMTFFKHIAIGDKEKGTTEKLFENFTLGVVTNRDAWCYNSSADGLLKNIGIFVDEYNRQLIESTSFTSRQDFFSHDPSKISWTRSLKSTFCAKKKIGKDAGNIVTSLYRPFTKQNLYYSNILNEMLYQTRKVYPVQGINNRSIAVSGVGARSGFSALMSDVMPNLHTIDTAQHFPIKLYDKQATESRDMFEAENKNDGYSAKDGITDYALTHFRNFYCNTSISKEAIFYYVYGLLHSEDYRARYTDNLRKQLPSIPTVKLEGDFWAFSDAGRKLGDLHVNYESVEKYPAALAESDIRLTKNTDPVSYYRVEKMRFGKTGKDKDLTTIHYNEKITVRNIPIEAYEYVVNGKSAIDWVVERQCVKTDKDSGIVNDANDWAIETMNNPRYPLELLLRVITVSLETMKIVKSLPKLDI
jgi:predicted helicase